MIGLRSLRNRLAVVFGLIVLGAIGTIYLTVTPRLEERLRNQKLERLLEDATRNVDGRPASPRSYARARTRTRSAGDSVQTAAVGASAEVLILDVARRVAGLRRRQDGLRAGRRRSTSDVSAIALDAVDTGRPASTTMATASAGGRRVVAYPLIQNKKVVGVAVFADTLDEVEGNVALIRRQILLSGGIALVIALLAGYLVARALSAARRPARAGGAQGRGGRLLEPDPRRLRRRARPARGRVRRHAEPARAARPRAQAVHRLGVARAAHADLLARRLPRAARRRGPRRGDAAPVPRPAARPGRPHAQARDRAARPVAAGGRRAGAAARADRRRPARARGRGRVHARPRSAHSSPVELRLADEPIELDCDPERVAQVLRILLDNALVHTPAGTGVQVSAARQNGHVRLEVSDRGLGIKRQNMPHIFEPFFTSNEEAQGAGLGLAIARELAERMQGRLTVRSAPGSTTFSLVLPG